jgi:hypothetical protein
MSDEPGRFALITRHSYRRALMFEQNSTGPGAACCSLAEPKSDRDRSWHLPVAAYPPGARKQALLRAASGRASRVRGKPQAQIVVTVGRIVMVAVGRAQVDRMIVPGAPARSLQTLDHIITSGCHCNAGRALEEDKVSGFRFQGPGGAHQNALHSARRSILYEPCLMGTPAYGMPAIQPPSSRPISLIRRAPCS